jgi:hypothetical protein
VSEVAERLRAEGLDAGDLDELATRGAELMREAAE